jgi:NADH-ubiquinone oxidoreductase chain 2
MGEQYKIIEYSLIILFIVTGALFLISTSDLVSIFLSIELQSYGLYLLSTIYRDSEPATSGGLMYFLLGAGGFRTSPVLCRKPSNSGKVLKLLVPSSS